MATRATKIVATLGPASSDPALLEAMIRAGVNVVRLNFSHGKAEDHIERARLVREAAQRAGREVGIMADLQGPKIRVGKFAQGKVQLVPGEKFVLDAERTEPGDEQGVGLDYKELPRDVKPGDTLLLNDGLLRLTVVQVQGDQGMLTAAIRNLIENAINYSDAGTRIGVGARLNAGFAEISVTDNGVGISQEEQERVFERFYRSDSSRSRATGGTGLGLSIVKHIAQQHRGEVKLFSQPGIGSTFTLRIPALAEPVSVIGLASSKVGSQPGSVAPSESEPNASKLA